MLSSTFYACLWGLLEQPLGTTLICISEPIVLCIEEEAMVLSVFPIFLHFSSSLCSFNPSLCHMSPFLLSCVAVSRPWCRLLEYYPNRALHMSSWNLPNPLILKRWHAAHACAELQWRVWKPPFSQLNKNCYIFSFTMINVWFQKKNLMFMLYVPWGECRLLRTSPSSLDFHFYRELMPFPSPPTPHQKKIYTPLVYI